MCKRSFRSDNEYEMFTFTFTDFVQFANTIPLDLQPGEWFYDKDSKTVYVKTLNGTSPAGSDVRGKVQTYAFTITNCTHVVIRDLTFFATTLHGASISKDNFISDLTIDSLIFKYPSYSRRMLHEPHPPQWTKLITKAGKGKGEF